MGADERVEMAIEQEGGGTLRLVFRARERFVCAAPLLELGRIQLPALLDFLGESLKDAASRSGVAPASLTDPRERFVLANGWQSWSFGGELRGGERPRRAIYKRDLNLFVDHPAEAAIKRLARGKGAAVSHFFTVLRSDDLRLAFVSDNIAPGAERPMPPLSFLVGKDWIEFAAYAEGGEFQKGENLAKVAVFPASGYFEVKDKFAEIFSAGDRLKEFGFLQKSSTHIGGFETWYNHYLDIDERLVLADIGAVGENENLLNAMFLAKGRPLIFQIDDGWERSVGDWRPDTSKFPGGMAKVAGAIEEKGCIPGLWLAPFLVMPGSPIAGEHPEWILKGESGAPVKAGWNPGWGGDVHCLDISVPEVEDYLVSLFDTVIEDWGFRYLKLDFLYAGLLRGRRKGSGGVSGGIWDTYGRIMRRIASRKADHRGRPVAYLSCGAPFEPTAPYMPLMRVGADTLERWDWFQLRLIGHQGRPSAKVNLSHTFARAVLNGSLLLNDPDVVFCRTEKTSLKDREKFLIGLSAYMFASQIMLSDDPARFGQLASLGMGEADFTRKLLSLYDKIGDKEFGIERMDGAVKGLYRFFSRDGSVFGCVNLSDRDHIAVVDAAPYDDSSEAVPALVPSHSMVLFGLEGEDGL